MKYWHARKNWQIQMWYHMELMATTSTHPPTTKTGGSLRQGKYWTVATKKRENTQTTPNALFGPSWFEPYVGAFSISLFPVFYFLFFIFIYFYLFYFI